MEYLYDKPHYQGGTYLARGARVRINDHLNGAFDGMDGTIQYPMFNGRFYRVLTTWDMEQGYSEGTVFKDQEIEVAQ